MAGVGSRPWRRLSSALSRSADGRGGPTPGDRSRFPGYVVARRYAVSGTARSRSVRVARPTVPPILLPFKITVKGALRASVLRTADP
jgi:hypothetical protein